ncbi:MAG: AmmeMemoRadiSam system protein A [Chloroflexi bacterium]|nr:AmmeMemoRadiSam system protein A [Chloroflexota bacterium]
MLAQKRGLCMWTLFASARVRVGTICGFVATLAQGRERSTIMAHPLVDLARRTIDEYIQHGRTIAPPQEQDLTPEMQDQAGVFVSLKKHGQLRGCIGTFSPTAPNVAQEIIHNAISAATRDPRFSPVRPAELDELDISVDVLAAPEPVDSEQDLDPKRYGLIVESRRNPWKRGLLLPDLEGVDTPEQQLFITRVHKAGITDPDEPVNLYRFEVVRYH